MRQVYSFAGIPVLAEYTYDYLARQCRGYESDLAPLVSVHITEADIAAEKKLCDDGTDYPAGYLESLAFYRKFSTAAAHRNVLLFHGSAIAFDGTAYIFTAPSGTGKSTHTGLCRQMYGDRVVYINDDKPLVRREENGRFTVYGTPWNGKHHLGSRISAPLGGICFLHRGERDRIEPANGISSFAALYGQTFRPENAQDLQPVLSLLSALSQVPLFDLYCTMSPTSPATSLPAMAAEYAKRVTDGRTTVNKPAEEGKKI